MKFKFNKNNVSSSNKNTWFNGFIIFTRIGQLIWHIRILTSEIRMIRICRKLVTTLNEPILTQPLLSFILQVASLCYKTYNYGMTGYRSEHSIRPDIGFLVLFA